MDSLQSAFAAALLNPDALPPRGLSAPSGARVARRFAVYRNNVVVGLVDALKARFPVVARLVGDGFFTAMAKAYATENPPRSRLMFLYGDAFADFVATFAPAAGLPYLADVARLEYARGRAYHAADAAPLPSSAYSSLLADALDRTTLVLHPSVEIVASPHPIVSVWRAHQGLAAPAALSGWTPETALVVRPVLDVETHLLPPGGHDFIAALSTGASFSRAALAAAGSTADFDAVGILALLIEARAGIRLAPAR